MKSVLYKDKEDRAKQAIEEKRSIKYSDLTDEQRLAFEQEAFPHSIPLDISWKCK